MQANSLIAVRMKNGNWKVKALGHADCHFDSWCGENGRIRTAPGQPHAGFASINDALLWAAEAFPTMFSLVSWGKLVGDGKWTDGREIDGSVAADTHWLSMEMSERDKREFREAQVSSSTQAILARMRMKKGAAK